MSKDLDFKKDTLIDPHKLDINWTEQAELARKWGKEWADAKRTAKFAKAKRKKIKAQIIKDVHSNPKKYGWTESKAPTATFIDSVIRQDSHFIDVDTSLINSEYVADLMEVAKFCMVDRRMSLQALLEMHKIDWFADSNLSAQDSEKMQDVTAEKMADDIEPTKLVGNRPKGGRP